LAQAQSEVMEAMTRLHAAASAVGGQELIDQLRFLHIVERRARHDVLGAVARLDFEGEFTARHTYPGPAVAELLACNRSTATRLVRLASQVFPTTLAGQPVAPVLAAALADWSIHPDHAEVISRVMSGRAARRLSPQQWAGAERQCAQWAAVYNPHTLRTLAEALIEQLDQDGDEPDVDADDQVNELHLTPDRRDGYGGHIRGRLDSATYDALAQALDGLAKPREDEGKTVAQRRADALGDLAEHALDTDELPECGGEKPHLTVILRHDDLKKQLRGWVVDRDRVPHRTPGNPPAGLRIPSRRTVAGREKRTPRRRARTTHRHPPPTPGPGRPRRRVCSSGV
jgi:5-methylcytosine-specific restriction protein A